MSKHESSNYDDLTVRIREVAGLALEHGFHNEANKICEYADAIQEIQRDALRYRWLRQAGAWESEIGMDELSKDPDKFDAAVDEEMAFKLTDSAS